jgi:hypothetical protein
VISEALNYDMFFKDPSNLMVFTDCRLLLQAQPTNSLFTNTLLGSQAS